MSAVLLSEAQRLAGSGLGVLPVKADKRPAVASWTSNQTTLTPPEALPPLFAPAVVTGLAVITGGVSGGLVSFDFDLDKDGEAREPFDLEQEFVGLWSQMVADVIDPATIPRQRTGSGGMQFFVRCPNPCGNAKLAKVPANNKRGFHTVIETRGEGGYALLPPSLHPSGDRYSWQHLDVTAAPTVTEAQLRAMIDAATALDRVGLDTAEEQRHIKNYEKRQGEQGGVIAAFNERHHPTELLKRYGYTQRGGKYLSPDSKSGNPGITVFRDAPLIYSHHGDVLGDGHAHDAFDVFALLEHGGDKKAAVKGAAALLGMSITGDPVISFLGSKNNKPLPQEGSKTVQESDYLGQSSVASNNAPFALNGKKTVQDSDYLGQSALPQIQKWFQTPKPPAPKWLVKNLLQDDAENSLAGEPGVGKSWIMADLAVSVATGTPFLGRETAQGAVLIINFDDAEALPRTWAERAAKSRGYEARELDIYYWQPDPNKPYPISGLLTPEVAATIGAIVDKIKPRLIVVDAFSTAFPGKDGNKGQDVVQVFEHLRQLRVASSGACILLIDHTPKQLMMESQRRGVSGSQQKHARTRSVHIVSKLEPSEVPGGGDVLEWRVHKINAAPYQAPFGITRHVDTLNDTARFEVRDVPKREKAPQAARAADAALTVIKAAGGKWVTRQEVMEQAQKISNASERTLREALINEVEKHPHVVSRVTNGKGKPKQYRWHDVSAPDDSEKTESGLGQSTDAAEHQTDVALNDSASLTAKTPKNDLGQRNHLGQSTLPQITPVPDAKNAFGAIGQRKTTAEVEEVRRRWQAGHFDSVAIDLGRGRKPSDLARHLKYYFERANPSPGERGDLEEDVQVILKAYPEEVPS